MHAKASRSVSDHREMWPGDDPSEIFRQGPVGDSLLCRKGRLAFVGGVRRSEIAGLVILPGDILARFGVRPVRAVRFMPLAAVALEITPRFLQGARRSLQIGTGHGIDPPNSVRQVCVWATLSCQKLNRRRGLPVQQKLRSAKAILETSEIQNAISEIMGFWH